MFEIAIIELVDYQVKWRFNNIKNVVDLGGKLSDVDLTDKFMDIARNTAQLSKRNTKVACVAVDKNFTIVGAGVNGYPAGFDDESEENSRDKSIHAEANCIVKCKHDIHGVYIYGLPPCKHCLKLIIQKGIKFVVFEVNPEVSTKDYWIDVTNNFINILEKETKQ